MLSPDPVKRNINPYPYCDNGPVNYNDPTGEIANILVGGLGAFATDFVAGTVGSALEQGISRGRVDLGESLLSGAGHDSGTGGFSLGGFVKDVLTGAITGGLGSAGFYGAGKAVEVLRGSAVGCRNGNNVMNPRNVHFIQNSIKNQTGEYTVLGNAEALKSGVLQTDLPEIRIRKDSNGKVWTLDHRRLAAYRMAELDRIPFKWATEEEVASQMWKMTTHTGGISIKLKVGNGKSIIIQ